MQSKCLISSYSQTVGVLKGRARRTLASVSTYVHYLFLCRSHVREQGFLLYRVLTSRCGSAEVTNMEDKCVCWMWKEWRSQTSSPASLSATLKFDALPWFLAASMAIYQIATTLHICREGCRMHWARMMRYRTQRHRTELRTGGSSPKLERRGQKLEGTGQKLEGRG